MLRLTKVSVFAKRNNLEVRLPVVVFDEDQGNQFLSEANTFLRKEVKDPRERYLLTRSMPDFSAWLKEEVLNAKDMKNLVQCYRKALELGQGVDLQHLSTVHGRGVH